MFYLKSKTLLCAFILGTLSLPAMSYTTDPLVDGINQCGVPVCSMQDTLTALRSVNGDRRGMYALNFKNAYKDSTDLKVLENLYVTGKSLKVMTREMGDEDWVYRSADELVNSMLIGLAKYSEIKSDKLMGYYRELGTQNARFSIIAYWQGEINKIEDIAKLEELINFADEARAHSIELGDEDWVPRAASDLLSSITVKLVDLDPVHEGLYDVSVDNEDLAGILPFNRITVMESSSSKNLVVTLINTNLRENVYSYTHAELKGNVLSGMYLSNNEESNIFMMRLDRKTGIVSGTVETTNEMIHFSGKQIYSSRSVFIGELPHEISEKDILGEMRGSIGNLKGTISIKSFTPYKYSASFISDSGSVILHFQGKFFPKNGVLSLTSGDKVKLTMAFRKGLDGAEWVGSSFSTATGTVVGVHFNPLN